MTINDNSWWLYDELGFEDEEDMIMWHDWNTNYLKKRTLITDDDPCQMPFFSKQKDVRQILMLFQNHVPTSEYKFLYYKQL